MQPHPALLPPAAPPPTSYRRTPPYFLPPHTPLLSIDGRWVPTAAGELAELHPGKIVPGMLYEIHRLEPTKCEPGQLQTYVQEPHDVKPAVVSRALVSTPYGLRPSAQPACTGLFGLQMSQKGFIYLAVCAWSNHAGAGVLGSGPS